MQRTTITPYRDGPYLVRGDFRLVDEDGKEIDAGRRTVALCRCGRSRLRPFCDGTHARIRFRAEGGASIEALERRRSMAELLAEAEASREP